MSSSFTVPAGPKPNVGELSSSSLPKKLELPWKKFGSQFCSFQSTWFTLASFPYIRYDRCDCCDRSKKLTQESQQSYGNHEFSDRSNHSDSSDRDRWDRKFPISENAITAIFFFWAITTITAIVAILAIIWKPGFNSLSFITKGTTRNLKRGTFFGSRTRHLPQQ